MSWLILIICKYILRTVLKDSKLKSVKMRKMHSKSEFLWNRMNYQIDFKSNGYQLMMTEQKGSKNAIFVTLKVFKIRYLDDSNL